jgi:hypothetical protein
MSSYPTWTDVSKLQLWKQQEVARSGALKQEIYEKLRRKQQINTRYSTDLVASSVLRMQLVMDLLSI